MKIKFLALLIGLTICSTIRAQTVTGEKGVFKKSVEIGGKRVDAVSTDSTLSNDSDLNIPTVRAAKGYVDNRLLYFPSLQAFRDTVRTLRDAINAGGSGNGANNYTVGTTFDPNSGLLTLERNQLTPLQVNIDGRYAKKSELSDSMATARAQLAPDGNNYPSGLSFNQSTGILSVPRAGLSQLNQSLDGRYSLIQSLRDSLAAVRSQLGPDGNFYTISAGFNTLTGVLNLNRQGLGSLNVNMDGRYTENQRFQDSIAALRGSINNGANVSAVAATSVSDLKTKYPSFLHAETQGYYTSGDGGGARYRWNAFSTAVPDDITIIQPTSIVGAGRWELIMEGSMLNIKSAGLKGDNSNELTQLTKVLQMASVRKWRLYGEGTFNFNGGSVILEDGLIMDGRDKIIFRNGGYIHPKGDLDITGVRFQNWTTSVFYYPTGWTPSKPLRNRVEWNTFDTCQYAIYNQTDWVAGKYWLNSSFSYNKVFNVVRGLLSPKCDQVNLIVVYNLIDGVYNGGASYRNLFVLGGNGTINVANFSKNVTIQHNFIAHITFPQDNGDIGNQVIAYDGASVNMSFNFFYEVKAQNIYFSAEDAICQSNIHINDTTTKAEQAIIAKNGSYRGTSKVNENIVRGYFTTAIYFDSQTKYAEAHRNTIDIKGSTAKNGDAAIRYQNYGAVQEIRLTRNIIFQDQSDPNVVGMQVISAYPVQNTIIEENTVYTRSKGFQIMGPTFHGGLKVSFKLNKIKARLSSTIYGDDIFFSGNDITYPADTNTAQISIGARRRAFINNNNFLKDDSTAQTSFSAALITIPTEASRRGAEYYFNKNYWDISRASYAVSVENFISTLQFDGDRIITPYTGTFVRFRAAAGMGDVRMNNVEYLYNTGTTVLFQNTDTTTIKVVMTNSTFLNPTLLNSTANAARGTLIIDNCELATSPSLLRNWAIRKVRVRTNVAINSTSTSKTLVFADLLEGRSNYMLVNATGARTITIPDTSSGTILPIGVPLRIIQQGVGTVTVAGAGAVVLNASDGLVTSKQYQVVEVVQTAYNVWNVNVMAAGGSGGSTVIDTTSAAGLVTKSELKDSLANLKLGFDGNEFQLQDDIVSLKSIPATKLDKYSDFQTAYRTALNLASGDTSIVVAAGVIRPRWGNIANGDTITWEFLTPTDQHGKLFFTGVRAIQASSTINVYYPRVSNVISFTVVPDEYLSSKGVFVGSSVGVDSARINVYAITSNLNFTTTVGNGTGWTSGSFVWSAGSTVITPGGTTSAFDAYANSVEYTGTNNYFVKYSTSGIASNTLKIELWDRVTNTKVTTAPTASDGLLLRRPPMPSLINPYQFTSSEHTKNVFGAAAANQSSSGNFWIIAVFKK